MIDTNTRNKIIEETRKLLDQDFKLITIRVDDKGFSIVPMKEYNFKDTVQVKKEGCREAVAHSNNGLKYCGEEDWLCKKCQVQAGDAPEK